MAILMCCTMQLFYSQALGHSAPRHYILYNNFVYTMERTANNRFLLRVSSKDSSSISCVYENKKSYFGSFVILDDLLFCGQHSLQADGNSGLYDIFQIDSVSARSFSTGKWEHRGPDLQILAKDRLGFYNPLYAASALIDKIHSPINMDRAHAPFRDRGVVAISGLTSKALYCYSFQDAVSRNREQCKLVIEEIIPVYNASQKSWGKGEVISKTKLLSPFCESFIPIVSRDSTYFVTDSGSLFSISNRATAADGAITDNSRSLYSRISFVFSNLSDQAVHYVVGVNSRNEVWYMRLGNNTKPVVLGVIFGDDCDLDLKVSLSLNDILKREGRSP